MLSFYILNVILQFFTILNCDCKFEFKIFYVLHVPLEAKKNVIHIYRKFYNLMKETYCHNMSSEFHKLNCL